MKHLKKILLIPLAFVLIACGGSSSYTSTNSYNGASNGAYVAESATADYGEYEGEYKEEAFANIPEEESLDKKLVYTGNISVETLNYKETVEKLRAKITEVNGFIEWQDETDNAGYWYSSTYEKTRGTKNLYLRARIPSASFNSFMNEADGLGKIISRSTNVENITKQYNDNASQIESLKIQESKLLEMMEKAETIDEMITVEARLSEIQSQLKSANNYQSSMDTDVEYSTVTINIAEVMEFTPLETGMVTSNFFRRLQDTLEWTWTFSVWLVQ